MAPLLFLAFSGQAPAEPPRLIQPVECRLGQDCHILQNVDRRPGPGVEDHACGTLSSEGHTGTDFALATEAQMAAGVRVRAAAPGRVRGLRDGMPDIDTSLPTAPDVTGRECGNGVTIDHGQGWRSQYCHLRAGSIRVRKGQMVEAGETLGLIGMSGAASFPHLHFALRRGSAAVDPFRPDSSRGCGRDSGRGLWQQAMPYRPAGLLGVGIADHVPDYAVVKQGLPEFNPGAHVPALVVWGFAFGGRQGDEIRLTLEGPSGSLGSQRLRLEEDRPRFYRAWGKRAPETGFAPGRYSARVELRRGVAVLDRRESFVVLP
ncbi:M23 family metallopeptidase [Tropicimonas sp. IMCC6043]|nr:M23 family metallopeptidase [Tropicimonas sp. IMCC6043]